MRPPSVQDFAKRLYRHRHGAEINPGYLHWRSVNAPDGHPLAVLGYRPAHEGPLYLERYLECPIEQMVSVASDSLVGRGRIVEIGCLAALPSGALLRLWRDTATLLESRFDFAVATLTAPLRGQFRRAGVPFTEIACAAVSPGRAQSGEYWGRYYDEAPMVCVGRIADGAVALTRPSSRGRMPA